MVHARPSRRVERPGLQDAVDRLAQVDGAVLVGPASLRLTAAPSGGLHADAISPEVHVQQADPHRAGQIERRGRRRQPDLVVGDQGWQIMAEAHWDGYMASSTVAPLTRLPRTLIHQRKNLRRAYCEICQSGYA